MFPRDRFISSVERKFYFFFLGVERVCERALPATDFEAADVRPSFKIFEAVEATFLLVCFLLAMLSPPLE